MNNDIKKALLIMAAAVVCGKCAIAIIENIY